MIPPDRPTSSCFISPPPLSFSSSSVYYYCNHEKSDPFKKRVSCGTHAPIARPAAERAPLPHFHGQMFIHRRASYPMPLQDQYYIHTQSSIPPPLPLVVHVAPPLNFYFVMADTRKCLHGTHIDGSTITCKKKKMENFRVMLLCNMLISQPFK